MTNPKPMTPERVAEMRGLAERVIEVGEPGFTRGYIADMRNKLELLDALSASEALVEALKGKLASRTVTRCQKCGVEALPSPTHALDLEWERDEALREVEALKGDKERLDWMNEHPHGVYWNVSQFDGQSGWMSAIGNIAARYSSLRSAIDYARASRPSLEVGK